MIYTYLMIKRPHVLLQINKAIKRSRITALIGPRQCGKTTLARTFVSPSSPNYFDLEDPASLRTLSENPMNILDQMKGLVVIDEVQRLPDLFPILRVLADRKPLPARFLILGSAAPHLLRQSSESLAGRIETIDISGLSAYETGWGKSERHWLRGGFPLSFLARSEEDSFTWRKNFTQTFLERDIPQLGFNIPASTLFRFWTMLAHYHGQVWNGAEPARSLNISESSVRRYVDLLTDVFMIRQLQPWHNNLKKRQVKSPKIYFRDTGLLHTLLGIHSKKELLSHPKYGASWEGYVIEEVHKSVTPDESYFWRTHNGAEIDLLIFKDSKKIGIECKRTDAPFLTPSMSIALQDLKLDHLFIIYPGHRTYKLNSKVTAVPSKILSQPDTWKILRNLIP